MTHQFSMFDFYPLAKGGLTPVWHFIGAFHPATTHIPIGLLMTAGVIEAFNIVRYRGAAKPNYAAVVCLCLGALGSILTAAVGWGLRAGMKDTDLVELHRWMGVSLVVFSLVVAVISIAAYRRPRKPITRTYQAGALISAGLVGLVGMYGGELSFGKDHYAEAWDKMRAELSTPTDDGTATKVAQQTTTAPVAPTTTTTSPTTIAANSTAQPSLSMEFTRDILPIFDANCVKCHGADKQKGDYRLDTLAHTFTSGETKDEKPIIPGDSEKSYLVKLIVGKGDFEDLKMPPKGKSLTEEQIGTIKKWIDQGAH